MNNSTTFTSRDDQLLAKLGGRYVFHVQAIYQTISALIGPIIGLYFIYAAANLSRTQLLQFFISYTILTVLSNLFISIYLQVSSRQARARLDLIFKNRPLPDYADETLAWKEILTLPRKAGATHIIFSYLLAIIPTILFMQSYAAINSLQILIIIIGCTLTEVTALVQGILFMDIRLAAPRRALIPSNPTQQSVRAGIRLSNRSYAVIILLLLLTQIPVSVLVYQSYSTMLLPGTNPEVLIEQLQQHLGIIGIIISVLGLLLASRLSNAVSKPIKEMMRTIDEIQQGGFSQRATIISSDETAELTIRLNQLLDQLQVTRLELEQNVEQRTRDLVRKTAQLEASARVARDAASMQDINVLLSRTAGLISEQFGFYHTGIFLVDDSGVTAILQAASSEGGKRMLERGHQLEVGQGIVGSALRQNKPRVATDVGSDLEYFNNPDLPATRSELAIPLFVKGKVIGALDIQSTEQTAFSKDDIQVLQTLADQIALAIQNARLIAESQNALQRLESATSDDMRRTWRERVRDARKAYRYTAIGITPLAAVENKDVTEEPGANKINIPITLRGQRIGNINLNRKGGSKWADADRSLAIEIANQVGLALENARLLEEAQRRAAQEQSISDLTARLGRSLDIDTLLQTTLRELHQLPNVTETSVYISPPSPSGPAQKSAQDEG